MTSRRGLGTPPQLLECGAATEAIGRAAEEAGLGCVGWLVTCPPRARDFSLRAEEVAHDLFWATFSRHADGER